MRPVLLDTNAYVSFKRGVEAIVEVVRCVETIAFSPIVLGELLSGFELGSQARKNREELQHFLQSSRIRVFNLTLDTANYYSQVYASLRKKGKPIPTNDMWIAAQALENGCVLCSHDKHFKVVENLISGSSLTEVLF